MLTCFVDKLNNVHASKEENAVYLKYEFDLVTRTLVKDYSMSPVLISDNESRDKLAQSYFDKYVGTSERLMSFVKEVGLSKLELAELLNIRTRGFYLDVCGIIERSITEYCASKKDEHCLEEGCPFVSEGICTEACNRDGHFYTKSCANIWVELFKNPLNRIDVWRS